MKAPDPFNVNPNQIYYILADGGIQCLHLDHSGERGHCMLHGIICNIMGHLYVGKQVRFYIGPEPEHPRIVTLTYIDIKQYIVRPIISDLAIQICAFN